MQSRISLFLNRVYGNFREGDFEERGEAGRISESENKK